MILIDFWKELKTRIYDRIYIIKYFGRIPTGRAIRYNLFLPQAQHKKSIFAAIPYAKKLQTKTKRIHEKIAKVELVL